MALDNLEVGYMDREKLGELQLERLINTVKKCEENVPFYKTKMKEVGITWKDIKTLSDIENLPFTTKEDLRSAYPFGHLAVPPIEIVRIQISSGISGEPTIVGYTKKDIETWSALMRRALTFAGIQKHDIVVVAFEYGLLTSGIGFHYGAESLGATVIPSSVSNTKTLIKMLKDFGATVLCSTPSYAFFLGEQLEDMGIDRKQLKLKCAILGEEIWDERLRKQIERILDIETFDIYGISEIMGPGVAVECDRRKGLHIFEDAFYPEIVRPETGEVLGPEEEGELVLTTLTKEGMPLVRYRTGDVTCLFEKLCDCGSSFRTMARIKGRTDDMLIIQGVNIFPSQIESVLMSIEGITPSYQIVVDTREGRDVLQLNIEVTEEMFSDKVQALEELRDYIKLEVESAIGIGIKVCLVEPRNIERYGESTPNIDRRS